MYKIKNNLTDIEILFYDQIGFGGIKARDVIAQLKSISVPGITLRINSEGGDLGEALAVYNYIKSLNVETTVYIDGIAYSAASIIAMSGDKVIMPETAMMMIHNPWTECYGEAEDMRRIAEQLDAWRDICAEIYMKKTGRSYEEITAMMNEQTEMNGKRALELGFADELGGIIIGQGENAFQSGVKAERERIRALDELMTPERADLITMAKYESLCTAQDIALMLLKREQPLAKRLEQLKWDAGEIDGVSMKAPVRDEVSEGVKMMNRMRGYE